jgi:hypothetical protein
VVGALRRRGISSSRNWAVAGEFWARACFLVPCEMLVYNLTPEIAMVFGKFDIVRCPIGPRHKLLE